jgi:hypothetical protein
MKRNRTVKLRQIFMGLQRQMEARLTFTRGTVHHPGAKGTASELEWIEMLATYLPKRYCADSAFVVDALGKLSDQIDIVIYDRQYSPFILRQNGVTYIPAECVYAVIEVKQSLTKANIAYAQRKAASVRRLKRTSIPIPHAGGVYDPRKPARILAGIVALDGTISRAEVTRLANAKEKEVLNFGCSLTGRTFFHLPDIHPWDRNASPYKVEVAKEENSLVKFFMCVVIELQKVGTVPALDIAAYM